MASQECREIIPPLEEKRPGHFAACIKVGAEPTMPERRGRQHQEETK
jgi:hypothetical protein